MILLISFTIANLFTSWLGSLFFTGENYKDKWGLSDDKIFKPISNKKWKTFLIFFIGYWIIGLIIYFTQIK